MGAYHEEEPGALKKYRGIMGCGLLAASVIAVWFGHRLFNRTAARPRQEQNIVMVNVPPPPSPPLAPPPPPPKESEQKIIEQETVNPLETKADTAAEEHPAAATPAVGTSIVGGGPDGFGVGHGNSYFGGVTGGDTQAHVKGSRWGWYANQVQSAIAQALQRNNNTRLADFRVVVKIWPDQTGRITRATIAGSTGDVAVDNAITNQVLAGLVLQEPPPDGMPMPIVLRLTARRSTAAFSRQ